MTRRTLQRELKELIDKTINLEQSKGRKATSTKKSFTELGEMLITFKLAPKVFDTLTANMRNMQEDIRIRERDIMHICVTRAKMPKKISKMRIALKNPSSSPLTAKIKSVACAGRKER